MWKKVYGRGGGGVLERVGRVTVNTNFFFFFRLIGKVQVGLYFYLTLGILTKV